MYTLIKNGSVAKYPYWPTDLKYQNPSISFPAELNNGLLESFGVLPVTLVDRPSVSETKTVSEGIPEFKNGLWFQVWNVKDASAEEIQERYDVKSADIRYQRNVLLSSSDWTQVADAPVDQAAWATYRQQLRDISAQAGFPWAVEWPTQPE